MKELNRIDLLNTCAQLTSFFTESGLDLLREELGVTKSTEWQIETTTGVIEEVDVFTLGADVSTTTFALMYGIRALYSNADAILFITDATPPKPAGKHHGMIVDTNGNVTRASEDLLAEVRGLRDDEELEVSELHDARFGKQQYHILGLRRSKQERLHLSVEDTAFVEALKSAYPDLMQKVFDF